MKKILFTLLVFSGILTQAFSQNLITSLPSLYSYPGQQLIVPVQVSNFNGVASVSLVLQYDASVLQFTGLQNVNSNLSGSFMTNSMPGTDGQILALSWFALVPANIGNGTMMELKFNYLGGSTNLKWDTLTFGNCQYSNLMGEAIPAAFINGNVSLISPNMTYSPQLSAIPSTDVFVPVTVASFNNIAEIKLTLSHNHSVINYQSVAYINPQINNSNFSVTDNGDLLQIDWHATSEINLGDDTLFILHFQYIGGSSLLSWDTITPGACYYKDANSNLLPGTFVSGMISPALIQVNIASAAICNGGDVILPVNVSGANVINSFELTLNYNPSVVSFTSFQNLNSDINDGNFNITDNNGILHLTWNSANSVDIGNSVLCDLSFHTIVTNGGLSDMSWDNANCEFHNPDSINYPLNLVSGSLMVTPFINLGTDIEVCKYHTANLFAGALFSSYLWSTGDTTSGIEVDSTMGSGVYSVTVTDVNGCTGYDQVKVDFMPCTGIEEIIKSEINIFPNPVVNGSFTFTMSNLNKDAMLTILDISGREIEKHKIIAHSSSDYIEEFHLAVNKGIYFLKVQSSDSVLTKRLLVD